MKPVLAAFLSIAAIAPHASFAQSPASGFDGLSAAINLNFPSVEVKLSDPFGNRLGTVSTTDQNYAIQLAKGLAWGSNGVFSFGAFTQVGDMKATALGPLQLKATANYAVFTELGYAFNRQSMAYGKLSLNQLTAAVSGGGPGTDETLRASGSGIGAGYRYGLSNAAYLQAEIMQIDYATVASVSGLVLKPTSSQAMLGLGVRF
jgi:hypothetical protein